MAGCSAHSLQAAPTRPPGASTRRSEEHRSTTQQGDAPVDGHGAHAPDHPRRRRRAVPGHHLQRLEGGRHTWAPSSSTMSPSLPVILTGVGIQPTTDQGKTVITREYSLDCRGRGYSLDSRRNGHCQSASWARAGRACAAFVTRCYMYPYRSPPSKPPCSPSVAGTFCSRAATPTGVISSFVRSATMAICNHLPKPTAKWPTLPPQPRDTTN